MRRNCVTLRWTQCDLSIVFFVPFRNSLRTHKNMRCGERHPNYFRFSFVKTQTMLFFSSSSSSHTIPSKLSFFSSSAVTQLSSSQQPDIYPCVLTPQTTPCPSDAPVGLFSVRAAEQRFQNSSCLLTVLAREQGRRGGGVNITSCVTGDHYCDFPHPTLETSAEY